MGVQCGNGIGGFREGLEGFVGGGAGVPEVYGCVCAACPLLKKISTLLNNNLVCWREGGNTRNNNRIPLTRKLHRFDTRVMPVPATCCDTLFYIPEEDSTISAYAGEARIICGHGDVEDGVAVGFVTLDRRGGFCGVHVRDASDCAREVD